MSTNYRALCADLLDWIGRASDLHNPEAHALMARARAALKAESEGPTMAEEALVALDRIQRGDASHSSDDFDLVANALGQLRRWGTPPALSATCKITGLAWPQTLGDWNLMGPPNRLGAWRWYRRTVLINHHPVEEQIKMDSLLQPVWESLIEVDNLDGPPSTFPAPSRSPATLLQQQATELAALRGMPVAGISDEHRDAVREAVAEALGNAYDCQRVWSAWNVGTMGPDDFVPIAEDDDRVAEIADAAIEAFRTFQVSAPQAGEGEA